MRMRYSLEVIKRVSQLNSRRRSARRSNAKSNKKMVETSSKAREGTREEENLKKRKPSISAPAIERRFIASILTTAGEITSTVYGSNVSDAEEKYRRANPEVIYCVVRAEIL